MKTKATRTEIEFLDATTLSFERTEGDVLRLKIGRKSYPRVHVHRCFPFSNSEKFISVRVNESEEIGVIADLADLSANQRRIVGDELSRRYFTPTIQSVDSVKEEFGYSYWVTTTDAGRVRFTIHAASITIIQVDERAVIITDIDGNRFLIPDYTMLTGAAARVLEFVL